MNLDDPLEQVHQDVHLLGPISFDPVKMVLLMHINTSYLMHQINSHGEFPRSMPHTDIPLTAQFSTAHLLEHMARTLATVHEFIYI